MKDWVRKEIAIALEQDKIVIPVTHNFVWPAPDALPENIRGLCSQNGVEWIHMYQQACIAKICQFIGRSKKGTGDARRQEMLLERKHSHSKAAPR